MGRRRSLPFVLRTTSARHHPRTQPPNMPLGPPIIRDFRVSFHLHLLALSADPLRVFLPLPPLSRPTNPGDRSWRALPRRLLAFASSLNPSYQTLADVVFLTITISIPIIFRLFAQSHGLPHYTCSVTATSTRTCFQHRHRIGLRSSHCIPLFSPIHWTWTSISTSPSTHNSSSTKPIYSTSKET